MDEEDPVLTGTFGDGQQREPSFRSNGHHLCFLRTFEVERREFEGGTCRPVSSSVEHGIL